MLDNKDVFPRTSSALEYSVCLPKSICALQVVSDKTGREKAGLLTQLAAGTEVGICGEGFNERTVKISAHGSYYFAFLQDVEQPRICRTTA